MTFPAKQRGIVYFRLLIILWRQGQLHCHKDPPFQSLWSQHKWPAKQWLGSSLSRSLSVLYRLSQKNLNEIFSNWCRPPSWYFSWSLPDLRCGFEILAGIIHLAHFKGFQKLTEYEYWKKGNIQSITLNQGRRQEDSHVLSTRNRKDLAKVTSATKAFTSLWWW